MRWWRVTYRIAACLCQPRGRCYDVSSIYNIIIDGLRDRPRSFNLNEDPAAQSLPALFRVLGRASIVLLMILKSFGARYGSLPFRFRCVDFCGGLGQHWRATTQIFLHTRLFSLFRARSESLHPLAPLTTSWNYRVIDSNGDVNANLRSPGMDGATVARLSVWRRSSTHPY